MSIVSPLTAPTTIAMPVPRTSVKSGTPLPTLRVLHVVNGEHFSGAERVQSHLGRCLPDHQVHADFASVKPGRFADRLEAEPSWGISHRIEMTNRFDFRAIGHLIRLIQQYNYNLLHAHTPRTAMITAIASARTGVPWIYHVHSPAARDSSRPIVNRINAWIERRSLGNCHGIITVSESLRADCIALGHAPEKINVVHNGVPAICPPRTSTPTPGGRWTIGMVALMRPRKGLEIVLQSLAKIRAAGHDVHLQCIGPFETTEYQASIDTMISSLGIQNFVHQSGFVDDVPSALANLDAMILPSLYGEGLPMVVLEAMAAAVPVIATRVEGTPEAINHGMEGLLANPGDAESLASEIIDLVTGVHDWSTMASLAKLRHQHAFSDHAMAEKTAAVYRDTLDQIV